MLDWSTTDSTTELYYGRGILSVTSSYIAGYGIVMCPPVVSSLTMSAAFRWDRSQTRHVWLPQALRAQHAVLVGTGRADVTESCALRHLNGDCPGRRRGDEHGGMLVRIQCVRQRHGRRLVHSKRHPTGCHWRGGQETWHSRGTLAGYRGQGRHRVSNRLRSRVVGRWR